MDIIESSESILAFLFSRSNESGGSYTRNAECCVGGCGNVVVKKRVEFIYDVSDGTQVMKIILGDRNTSHRVRFLLI